MSARPSLRASLARMYAVSPLPGRDTATFSPKRGTFQVPTRVFVRDGFVFRDSREGGGGVSLRWDQLTTVLAGAGLCHLHQLSDGTAHQPDASVWRPTARGEALLA